MVDLEAVGMRARILEMATRLFVAQGYHGISMREIGDACGISKPGLYYHFKDKEDLFLAILSDNLNDLEKIVAEAGRQVGGAREQIAFFARAIFTRLPAEHRAIIRLASQEMGKVSPEARADFNRRYEEKFIGRLADLLRQGMEAGELRALDPHLAVWGLLGLMYPFFNAAPGSPEEIIQFILTVFLEGLEERDGKP
jgi:AcrR family transcriptional regulator